MAITNGLRATIDLKQWRMLNPAPATTLAGALCISSRHFRNSQLFLTGTTLAWLYQPDQDAFITLPSPALAGTFGAGTCGTATAMSTGAAVGAAALTATAGTTSSFTTNQTLARDLRGYRVHIAAGPNAGVTLDIVSNTVGTNAVITVPTQGVAFSASTVYRLITPRWYMLNADTVASGSFRVYDYATNTWQTLVTTGLPAAISTDSKLIATPSFLDSAYVTFGNGTASAATGTTLTDGTKAWTVSQWINSQVRIVSGMGAGQVRTITANTNTQLTVAAWTITPDATSLYEISGNDDFLYYMGSNAATLYRYSISANTWSTLTPGVARGAAPAAGMSGHWVYAVSDTAWTTENAILNGRLIYSFRGAAGGVLDYYDIAANTWVNAVPYAINSETFTTGTKYVYRGDFLYIQKDATGRWFRFDFVRSALDAWSTMTYPQGAAVAGDTAFDASFTDGSTLVWIYMILNSTNIMLRQLVI